MLLPSTPRTGIVINLAELRLYYYPANSEEVIVYPIGIGQLGRDTPEMVTSVSQSLKTQHGRQRRTSVKIMLKKV